MMTRVFYKNAVACIIAFDVTKPATLTNGVLKWKQDVDAKLIPEDGQRIPCVLIGNKVFSPSHFLNFLFNCSCF